MQGKAFDPEAALALLDGDRELFQELVAIFLADLPDLENRVRTAIDGSDADAARGAAHAMKGAASAIGARGIAGAAREIESLGRAGDLTGAHAAMERLERELEAARPLLRELA